MNYKNKYIKYKTKYLNLIKILGGNKNTNTNTNTDTNFNTDSGAKKSMIIYITCIFKNETGLETVKYKIYDINSDLNIDLFIFELNNYIDELKRINNIYRDNHKVRIKLRILKNNDEIFSNYLNILDSNSSESIDSELINLNFNSKNDIEIFLNNISNLILDHPLHREKLNSYKMIFNKCLE